MFGDLTVLHRLLSSPEIIALAEYEISNGSFKIIHVISF